MHERCGSCGKKFGIFRKRRSCDQCKEEFCAGCLRNSTLSWGRFGEQRYELVFKKGGVGFRALPEYGVAKFYLLCAACRSKMDEMTKTFAAETRRQLASIVVTDKNYVPGHRIARRCGFIEYRPDERALAPRYRYGEPPPSLETRSQLQLVSNIHVLELLKRQAINRGANALINLRVAYYKKFVPPPEPPVSRRTPLDFVPGYVESRWREQARPLHKKMPIYRAEAVVISKEGKQKRERN